MTDAQPRWLLNNNGSAVSQNVVRQKIKIEIIKKVRQGVAPTQMRGRSWNAFSTFFMTHCQLNLNNLSLFLSLRHIHKLHGHIHNTHTYYTYTHRHIHTTCTHTYTAHTYTDTYIPDTRTYQVHVHIHTTYTYTYLSWSTTVCVYVTNLHKHPSEYSNTSLSPTVWPVVQNIYSKFCPLQQ